LEKFFRVEIITIHHHPTNKARQNINAKKEILRLYHCNNSDNHKPKRTHTA